MVCICYSLCSLAALIQILHMPILNQNIVEGPSIPLTDLLLVCQQMNREASGLFYTQNKFIVNLGSRRMYSEITEEGQLFSPEVLDARRRIRCLSLRMRRISGDFERIVVPAVADMILHGSLRILDVGILTQDAGLKTKTICGHEPRPLSQDSEAANLVKTTPFQAFLKLLADPDLEQVTLWVSVVHWSVWCSYHSVIEKSSRSGIEEPVDIDWRRLVRDFADGNRITKVERPRFG